jgi:hypothetical protein
MLIPKTEWTVNTPTKKQFNELHRNQEIKQFAVWSLCQFLSTAIKKKNYNVLSQEGYFAGAHRDGIFKVLRIPGIDSKELFPPAHVAWRAGTTALFLLGS